MRRFVGAIAGVAVAVIACENSGSNRVLGIEATGDVVGFVYFDNNANREPDAGDGAVGGIEIALLASGTGDTIASANSDDLGVFSLAGVPVGVYRVVVDTTTVGDSAIVASIDATEITVAPDDTVTIEVAISFPLLSVVAALALPLGEKVFVTGIALNARATFGDSTLHVADTSGTLRAVRVGPAAVFPGDSVRLRGTVATRDGRVVLDLDRRPPVVLSIAELPPPDTLTTGMAATANGGLLDAAFVRVDSARITDTVTVGDDFVVTVDDGTGALEVGLDGNIIFPPEPFLVPGGDLRVSGLLVHSGGGKWRLKPRSDEDVSVSAPVVTISEARMLPVGEVVFIDGVALNFLATFGDNTLHVSDTSASIRATRVRAAFLFPGDSVRLVGTIGLQEGQPVIDDATSFRLGISRVPPPADVTTAAAGSADGGVLDAALVRIQDAGIVSTATVTDGVLLTVDDGSGAVGVLVDASVLVDLTPFVPGAVVNVVGVLVPDSGVWVLKPRAAGDLTLQ